MMIPQIYDDSVAEATRGIRRMKTELNDRSHDYGIFTVLKCC
jgi:hypothetical protein